MTLDQAPGQAPGQALDQAPDRAERWALRPGAPVLRRDAETLQVGLDHPARVLLPDSPVVRALLSGLRDGPGRVRPGARSPEAVWWTRLQAADLLVPATGTVAAPGGLARGVLTATRAWAGPDAGRRVAARAGVRVRVHGAGALGTALARLLRGTGVLVDDADPGDGAVDHADLVVVAVDGEVHRGVVDPLVRHGTPHLLLWARGGLPRVGPLVVPGATACLRCLDAHDAEDDPRRPLLIEQAADQTAGPGEQGDPVLVALAAAWAARDVLRYLEGARPTTWSATVTLEASGPARERAWTRHPCCGCAWDVDLAAG